MSMAKAGDFNLEYYQGGAGPPLLLISGFTSSAIGWPDPFLERLQRSFSTVRYSHRGTGVSDRLDGDIALRDLADDAAALLTALGIDKAHVLGVSMGGMIAQELALNHPQRVQGLVLGCTNCGRAHGVAAPPEMVDLLTPQPELSREEQVRRSWPAITTQAFLDSHLDVMEERLRKSLVNPTPIETAMRQMAAALAFDSYERLPQIKAPTLVLHGDRDNIVPVANAHILKERILGAELRVFPGIGHLFVFEFPEESATAVVEFLAKVPVSV
ncbi:MAG TPA: alpha/beta hydrolase [Dehalococcoidia bacterium]|jgi:3-oxoadipate enol-lactonase|nr:alpha/beta hydrolase [Dehalococcoidia bacterium]